MFSDSRISANNVVLKCTHPEPSNGMFIRISFCEKRKEILGLIEIPWIREALAGISFIFTWVLLRLIKQDTHSIGQSIWALFAKSNRWFKFA